MARRSLRTRFVTAAALLVVLGTVAGVWTLVALSRLGDALGAIVRRNDEITAATARLSSALEREDDALLLVVAGDAAGRSALARDRAETDAALAALDDGDAVATDIAGYRAAADRATDLLGYHRDVNPRLRAAVAAIAAIRDRHFADAQEAASRAHAQARSARTVSLVLVAGALALSVLVALRLARTEELAAQSRMEATLAALPDAVVLIERGGRVAALNGEAEALLREVAGGARDLRALEALGVPAARVEAALAGDQPPARLALDSAVRVERAVGPRHLLPRILTVDGPQRRVCVVISDVTDLVLLDRLRAEMIAVASHELRTPVTTLRMTLGMLREGAAGQSPAMRELIDTAVLGVGQLTETVDELLDLARVEAGELRLAFEPVDLARMVDDALPRWRARAADRAVRIEVERDGAATVLADRGRFRIVLDNLVDNAIKYSPADGVIAIDIAGRSDTVAVEVRDQGPGVPEEMRARVFDKFFRVEDHRRRPGDAPHGTGIGLYLCRALVEMHGGTIRCEAGAGGGTRLHLEVPVSMQNAGIQAS